MKAIVLAWMTFSALAQAIDRIPLPVVPNVTRSGATCVWGKVSPHLRNIGGRITSPISPDDSITLARQTARDPKREEFLAADREYRTALEAVKAAEVKGDTTLGDPAVNKARLAKAKARRDAAAKDVGSRPVTRAYDPDVWVQTAKHPDLAKKIEELAQASAKLFEKEKAATAEYNRLKEAYEKAYAERLSKLSEAELKASPEFRALNKAHFELESVIQEHDQIQEELGWLRFCRDLGPRIESGELEVAAVMSQEEWHRMKGDEESGVQEWGERFPVVITRVTGKGKVSAVRTWSDLVEFSDMNKHAARKGGYLVLQERGEPEKYASSETLMSKLATPKSADQVNLHNRATRYELEPGTLFAIGITGPVRPGARRIPGTEGFSSPMTDLTGPVYTPDGGFKYLDAGTAGGAGGRQQITPVYDGKTFPPGSEHSPAYAGYTVKGNPRLDPEKHVVRELLLPSLPNRKDFPARRAFIDDFSPPVKKVFDQLYAANPTYRQLSPDPKLNNWQVYPEGIKAQYEAMVKKYEEVGNRVMDEIEKVPAGQREALLVDFRRDLDAHWSELIHIAPPDVRRDPPHPPAKLYGRVSSAVQALRPVNAGGGN